MTEQTYEVQGAGFIPGVPGHFANCRVIVEDGQVKRVEPLTAIEMAAEEAATEATPLDLKAQNEPLEGQSIKEDNQGG